MQKTLAGLCAATALMLPAIALAQAQATNPIEAKIQALLQQISQVTAQIRALTGTASTSTMGIPVGTSGDVLAATSSAPRCPAFSRTLSLGNSGNDVLSLQHFLNDAGMLDDTSLTGFFGAITEKAVRAWQKEVGVVTTGNASSTGWGIVGPKTKAAIAAACGGAVASPSTVGATMSIMQTQPLAITAHIVVNVSNTCAAQTYTLDWGDGSALETIPVAAKQCAAVTADLTHQYAAAGIYHLKIASGNNTTGTDVSVAGAQPVCVSPVFAVASVPDGMQGQRYTLRLITDTSTSSSLMLVATPLPAGLSLSERDATTSTSTSAIAHIWSLEGTPTQATTSDITISAHNECGNAQLRFSLNVARFY